VPPRPSELGVETEHVPLITQEEAVANIQALLDAKRERVRQGPSWPSEGGAGGPAPASEAHEAPAVPSPEATYANQAHERGEQAKRKG
jgi:hypothetical protein